MGNKSPKDLPIVSFTSPEKFEKWLEKKHSSSPGIWMRIYKKASGKKSIYYPEALDVALCHGWIDSQKKPYDTESWLQRFGPRRKRSIWSLINTGHVARLIKLGKMKPHGLKHVHEAKKDGRWQTAYHSQRSAELPADFMQELKKNKKAWQSFEALNRTNKYAMFYRLQDAKKPETREKRKKMFIKMLMKGKKLYP